MKEWVINTLKDLPLVVISSLSAEEVTEKTVIAVLNYVERALVTNNSTHKESFQDSRETSMKHDYLVHEVDISQGIVSTPMPPTS